MCPDGTSSLDDFAEGKNVIVDCSDGSEDVRSGGTRAWRNSNMGNIRDGTFTDNHGSIGEAGGFAVFPSESTGYRALLSLLRTNKYQHLSIDAAVAQYAPRKENNTAAYQAFVRKATGLNGGTRLESLYGYQLVKVAQAIRSVEGWKEGTVTNRVPSQ